MQQRIEPYTADHSATGGGGIFAVSAFVIAILLGLAILTWMDATAVRAANRMRLDLPADRCPPPKPNQVLVISMHPDPAQTGQWFTSCRTIAGRSA